MWFRYRSRRSSGALHDGLAQRPDAVPRGSGRSRRVRDAAVHEEAGAAVSAAGASSLAAQIDAAGAWRPEGTPDEVIDADAAFCRRGSQRLAATRRLRIVLCRACGTNGSFAANAQGALYIVGGYTEHDDDVGFESFGPARESGAGGSGGAGERRTARSRSKAARRACSSGIASTEFIATYATCARQCARRRPHTKTGAPAGRPRATTTVL